MNILTNNKVERIVKKMFLLILLTFSLFANAQLYPVQVTPVLTPPYNLKLSSYSTTTDVKLRVNILLRDVNEFNRQVRLKLIIRGQGLNIQSQQFVNGASPIFLNGGTNKQLTNLDLSAYFQLNNLLGINPIQYNRPLPDGQYNFCFEIYDFFTNQLISNTGCFPVFLIVNDPPFLNVPQRGEQIVLKDPVNIIFQWTPRHLNATNVTYEYEIREIWDNQIDPQAGFLASPPLYSETTRATTFLYNNTKPALLPDKTYAWRVRAISSTGISENSVFRNNGYSEIYNFRTTQNCDAPKFPLSEAISKSIVKINWQGNFEHNKYHVQYRKVSYSKETDKQRIRREKKNKKRVRKGRKQKDYVPKKENFEWFEVYTQNEQAQISNLEAGETYEFRIGGTCTSLTEFKQYYSYTNTNEFTMPTEEETVNYNCGVLPDIQIANQDPIQNIGVNETFIAGDFPVTVKEIQNNGGKFTGKGFIVVPYLADTKIAVAFEGITINTNYQLIEGVVQTTYDPTWGSSVNVLISGLQDSINNILDLLENYTGSEEDIKALQDAINGLNSQMDGVQGNESIPDEIKALLSEELQDSFNSSAENLTAQEENPKSETKEETKDKLSQIKEAMTNVSNSLNAGSEQGDRTDDPKGFFDGYLPLKNNDTALTIKNLDNGGTFTIPIKASNENQTFYQDYTVNLNGTTYTIIYTSSISSAEDIEKARAKVSTPENGVVIYYHYDTENNRLGYKVEVDRTYFGDNMSDDDFDFSKKTFKEGLNNLIAELKAVDDWSAEIFEITVGLNNRIKQLLDGLILPDEMWNPDNAIYDEVPVHFEPLPAGLIDGVLEEVKSVPLLISLVIDYNTSKETQQKIDALVSDFDFTDAMDKWYEGRKDLYTSGPAHIIEYRTGKDVVGVATILTGAGAVLKTIKKGSDFIEGLVGQVKKKLTKKIGSKINFASKIDNVIDAISDTSKNADEVLEELSKTNKVAGNNQVTEAFKKFWQQHEANVSNYINKTYGLLNVGRQITVDIYITGKGKVTCRLDNLVKLDNGMFKIIDAKSSILQDLSTKEVSKLIGEFSTKNQKVFYEALKNGTIEKITPRGQRALDYFKRFEEYRDILPENLNIEKSIDFYVNDVATSGYGIYKTTY